MVHVCYMYEWQLSVFQSIVTNMHCHKHALPVKVTVNAWHSCLACIVTGRPKVKCAVHADDFGHCRCLFSWLEVEACVADEAGVC